MVYGNADFMGLPWETVIKRYRAQLGRSGFRRLEEYGPDFLRFVERSPSLFPARLQNMYCYGFVRFWLWRLKRRLRLALEDRPELAGELTARQIRSAFKELLEEDIRHLKGHPNLPRLAGVSANSLKGRYRDDIRRAIVDELELLSDVLPRGPLEAAAALALLKDLYWGSESGLVISGFGRNEVLPRLRCYRLDGIVGGRLRAMEERGKRSDITADNGAAVSAFAQSEMVSLFMNGVDPGFADFIKSFVAKSFSDGYPEIVKNMIGSQLSRAKTARMMSRLKQVAGKLTAALESATDDYSREMHWLPIIEIVNHLPKEELAAMAEALVNLTSFKRHVTKDAETVGGPIDVAVISRGDGLVWIKRKHYFSTELNRHFLANYYYDVGERIPPYAKKNRFFPVERARQGA
jgi:hypothetical protein